MPDTHPRIERDARYSIRLTNHQEDVAWFTHNDQWGANIIGAIKINHLCHRSQ